MSVTIKISIQCGTDLHCETEYNISVVANISYASCWFSHTQIDLLTSVTPSYSSSPVLNDHSEDWNQLVQSSLTKAFHFLFRDILIIKRCTQLTVYKNVGTNNPGLDVPYKPVDMATKQHLVNNSHPIQPCWHGNQTQSWNEHLDSFFFLTILGIVCEKT